MEQEIHEYRSVLPSYLENSVLKERPFYHTGFESSLENIVLKEEPARAKDIVEKLFSDKSKTLKATIKALFNEIMLRERLDSLLIYEINETISRQHNHLERARQLLRFNYSTDFLDYFSKAKMHIEGNVLQLEKERRGEYLACWKDLASLKKYLLSSLKDYWTQNSNTYFLNAENERHGEFMQETEAYNWKQG